MKLHFSLVISMYIWLKVVPPQIKSKISKISFYNNDNLEQSCFISFLQNWKILNRCEVMIKIICPGEAGFRNFLFKLYSKIAMKMIILRRKLILFVIRWLILPNNVILKLIHLVSCENKIVFRWKHRFSLIFSNDLWKISFCLHVFAFFSEFDFRHFCRACAISPEPLIRFRYNFDMFLWLGGLKWTSS